jgi:cytochrome c
VIATFSTGFIPDLTHADCPQPRKTQKAPKNIYNKKNPLRNTQKNISAGQKLFFQQRKELGCVRCHGVLGNGKGDMATGLEPPPRNFSCAPMMNKIPDGQLFWIIKNGSTDTGMYVYNMLKDEDIWQLILFIRQFAKSR